MKAAAEVRRPASLYDAMRGSRLHLNPSGFHAFAAAAKADATPGDHRRAGGAAHLAGRRSSMPHRRCWRAGPVQGPERPLGFLLSIVQMPAAGVGTLAIGEVGARNAGLLPPRSRRCPMPCRLRSVARKSLVRFTDVRGG
jgi:phosphoribosylcarboxyaminoimidazole (NCAIR) mutase